MTQTSLSDAGTVSDETRDHWRQAGRVARHLLPADARDHFDPVVNGVRSGDAGEDEYAVNVEFHFDPSAITVQTSEDEEVSVPTLAVGDWHDEQGVNVAFEEFSPTVDSSYGRPGQRVTVRAAFSSGVEYRIHIRVFAPDD